MDIVEMPREDYSGGDQGRQIVERPRQGPGKPQEHGHGTVADRTAPNPVDPPSVSGIGYQHGHR